MAGRRDARVEGVKYKAGDFFPGQKQVEIPCLVEFIFSLIFALPFKGMPQGRMIS